VELNQDPTESCGIAKDQFGEPKGISANFSGHISPISLYAYTIAKVWTKITYAHLWCFFGFISMLFFVLNKKI
jgi:hypothetical protein